MLYKFKLGHDAMEETKSIYCLKDDGVVDHSIVTRWFKKISLRLQESWQLGKVS